MASISSIASVFVILLVAYCSAVPLPTDNVYTTEKTMVERESMPMTFSGELNTYSTKLDHKREFGHKADSSESREYTTGLPHVQREFVEKKESDESREYTTGLPHVQREFVDKKESSESREYTTGLPLVERELLEKKDSSESHEYTTGLPHVQREYVEKKESDESHEYTTGLPHVERELVGKKESSESGEHTTERTLINDGHKKRTIFGETTFAPFEATSMINKREHEHVEGDSDEMTTERTIITGERDLEDENTVAPEGEDNNNESDKRSAGINMFDGLTTEYAMTKDGHHKRTVPVTAEPFYFEATSMFNEHSLAGESEEKTTERSFIPRTFDFDRFTTMESATDFNGRVEHKNERELVDPELTTFTPESSEHRERAIYRAPSMTVTKDVYRPVNVQKTLTKTGYPSLNQVSYDKSYTKTNYNH